MRVLFGDELDRKKLQEYETWKELEDYMVSWDIDEKRRRSILSTNNLAHIAMRQRQRLWKTTSSNCHPRQGNWGWSDEDCMHATKAKTLKNDIIKLSSKTKELGWSDQDCMQSRMLIGKSQRK